MRSIAALPVLAVAVSLSASRAVLRPEVARPEDGPARLKQTQPAPGANVIAGADRPDIPDWWKQSRGFYCPFANSGAGASLMKFNAGGGLADSLQNFRDLPKLLEDARKLGTNVIYLVDYWEPGYEYKGTYTPYSKCGGEEALRDGIAAVHAQGGRVILYLEAFIISRKTEFGRKVGPDWAMMNEKGGFYSYFDTGDRFYLMYPGEGSGWTDYIANLAGEMARKYNIDGVHLDSYGLQWGWKDYNPRHAQGTDPNAFNRGAVDLVKRVRSEMRKHNPQAVVILEGAEHTELLEACDGAQIESLAVLKQKPWWTQRRYPIYTSSFDLAEMKSILDEGYQLALSPWWFKAKPGGRDEKNLAAKTDKRNRFDQLQSLNRYHNLLLANGLGTLPAGASERISESIIAQLNGAGWKGEFVNSEFQAAAADVLARYGEHAGDLKQTPAEQIRNWMQTAHPKSPGQACPGTSAPREVVLFDGKDMSAFKNCRSGAQGNWQLAGAVSLDPTSPRQLIIEPGAGIMVNSRTGTVSDICTVQEFGDIDAHFEFLLAEHSNSGIYFQGEYELQILDSYGREHLSYEDCGGVYARWVDGLTGGTPPLRNGSKPAGQWQTFDVVFRAPRFDAASRKIENARFVSVRHNGVLIHENLSLEGPTAGPLTNREHARGPLRIQGDHGPVAFRNVRVKLLDK